MLGCGHLKADDDLREGLLFFDTTITAHSRIPPNRILRTVLSQSAFIPRQREGGNDSKQRMRGEGGDDRRERRKNRASSGGCGVSSARNRPGRERQSFTVSLFLNLDIATRSHCAHRLRHLHRPISLGCTCACCSPQWQHMNLPPSLLGNFL